MPGTERDRPRLRIETGAHQGRVLGCDIDYAGTLLLTAGDDRTARLWSVPELRPLGVLRPPFGETPDGSLYAAALSPDGSMGVVAGYAAGPLCLHVFDVARCEIVHRVKLTEAGGESVATLRFSPDGELLAVGTGGLGLILFATAGWRHIGADAAYGARVTGLDFTTEGDRLAVASEDGVVRLYDRKALAGAARPSLQAETSAGRLAASIRFAPPDGETLALGFEDGGLELRGARDLALRASRMPERLVGNASVPSVAWSADGASLFAAGNTCFVENEWVVLRADARGTGPWQPMRDHLRTNIGYLRDVPGAGCLVVTRGGEIALYGSDGARRAEVLPPQGDVRADHEAADPAARTFCLSYGGTLVEWTTATRWRGFRFDALNLELKSAPLPPPFGLAGWNSALGEVRVEGWDGGENPTLHTADGRRVPLELGPGERAQSVDLHHGKLLLGASFGLRRFAMADGTLLVHRPIDQAAWRVNQSQDGRLTVAALYDGTIRWYRAEDLEELLAVFVTDEPSPRWVAFTPDGWYAAGAGAEELIGWHLDRGEGRSAAFFPASAFRERFHRPDLVRRVLRTRDPAEALRQADAARGDAPTPPPEQQLAALHGDRPPTVTILVPREGALLPADGSVVIAAEVRIPATRQVQEVLVRVDGGQAPSRPLVSPLALAAPAPEEAASLRLISVELGAEPRPKAVLEVFALDESRRSSPSAVVTLLRPPALQALAGEAAKPRLLAVLAGISAYAQAELRKGVAFAAQDARDLARSLGLQRGVLYREVICRPLAEEQVTRDGLLDALDWLEKESTGTDTALLFLAGHGMNGRRGVYYFLTHGATLEAPDRQGLSGPELVERMRAIGARRVVMLDTCYAGAAGQAPPPWAPDTDRLMNALHSAGVPVYGATLANRRAVERPDLGNGVFTYALLGLLARPAQPLPHSELWAALGRRMKALTDAQEPAFLNAGSGADLALLAGTP